MISGFWLWLVVGVALAMSFLLSGMEAGVLALNPLRIRQWRRAGKPRAELLARFLEKPEDFLWTILVGNTLVNFTALSLIFMELEGVLVDRPVVFLAVFGGCVFLLFAWCELLPKTLFRMFPNRLCLWLVGPFQVVHVVLAPLVGLVAWVSRGLLRWSGGRTYTSAVFGSRDELRLALKEPGDTLTSEERALIDRVLDLDSRTVGSVMKPMDQVIAVSRETPMREVVRLCREHRLTRLPVWEESAAGRRVVGLLSLKTLLYQSELDLGRPASAYLKPALFLPETMRLEEAMRRMQRGGQRLAIVLGATQLEVGIVSLQDTLKVVFGEVSF